MTTSPCSGRAPPRNGRVSHGRHAAFDLDTTHAARYNNHIHIDVLSRFLPDKGKAGIQVVSALFTALVCGLVAYHATQLVLLDKEAATSAFGIVPIWISELIIPFGFAIIGLRYLFLSFGGIAALVRGQT